MELWFDSCADSMFCAVKTLCESFSTAGVKGSGKVAESVS